MEKRNKYAGMIGGLQEIVSLLVKAEEKDDLPVLERELILDKLRQVYDELLFPGTSMPETVEKASGALTPEAENKIASGEGVPREEAEEIADETELAAAGFRTDMPEEPVSTAPGNREPASHPEPAETHHDNGARKKPEIIADRISQPRSFKNEALGQLRSQTDLSSRLQAKPVQDIGKAIGLNDKFHYIRELFKGDHALYDKTIQALNHAQDFKDAFSYLNEHFDWDMDDPSVQTLLELTRRKFISQEHE